LRFLKLESRKRLSNQGWTLEQLKQTQADKFKEAARDLECDPDEAKREDKLRKVVKPKDAPEKPE
jgi:hypothetical protein